MRQKVKKLQLAKFEQIWNFCSFSNLRGFLTSQLIPTTLLNSWMFFDFRNYQLFSKNHARKVKFRQFTCSRIGNERFAEKKCNCFSLYITTPIGELWFFKNCARIQKIVSLHFPHFLKTHVMLAM